MLSSPTRIGLVLFAAASMLMGCATDQRRLDLHRSDTRLGVGVCYGPYREGQAPGGAQPTSDQVLEDLRIMNEWFGVFRTYSCAPETPAEETLRLIREHELHLKVAIGAWINPEATLDESGAVVERLPDNAVANRVEVSEAIRLANAYPDVVGAIIVGNETQVSWTGHKCRPETLIRHIRRAREQTEVPVTTADDYSFWLDERSRPIADEIDFIILHAYAMWNSQLLDDAVPWTDEIYRKVAAMHPDHRIVLGETGWATSVADSGEQAELIIGVPGEAQQARFLAELRAWAERTRTMVLVFEAFDEPWKGGDDPAEVEKHWGLFFESREPKGAMAEIMRPR
jgi:exo-beta-1,3-glucanase (GH17 family)